MKHALCGISLFITLSCSQPNEPPQLVSDSLIETPTAPAAATDSDADPADLQVMTTEPSSAVVESLVTSTNQSSPSAGSDPTLAETRASTLQPVFSDDFSKDKRADYTIKGNVSWEPGRLTLAEGASIEQAINGGPWAKVELDLEHVPLTSEQPTSELRVWFMLDGATNCYVRLRRQLEDGTTVGSVALVDTGEKDGKPVEQVVRMVIVDDAASGTVSVEYRSGLVRIAAQDDQLFAAYIENRSATVSSVTLQSVSTAVRFETSRQRPCQRTRENSRRLSKRNSRKHTKRMRS